MKLKKILDIGSKVALSSGLIAFSNAAFAMEGVTWHYSQSGGGQMTGTGENWFGTAGNGSVASTYLLMDGTAANSYIDLKGAIVNLSGNTTSPLSTVLYVNSNSQFGGMNLAENPDGTEVDLPQWGLHLDTKHTQFTLETVHTNANASAAVAYFDGATFSDTTAFHGNFLFGGSHLVNNATADNLYGVYLNDCKVSAPNFQLGGHAKHYGLVAIGYDNKTGSLKTMSYKNAVGIKLNLTPNASNAINIANTKVLIGESSVSGATAYGVETASSLKFTGHNQISVGNKNGVANQRYAVYFTSTGASTMTADSISKEKMAVIDPNKDIITTLNGSILSEGDLTITGGFGFAVEADSAIMKNNIIKVSGGKGMLKFDKAQFFFKNQVDIEAAKVDIKNSIFVFENAGNGGFINFGNAVVTIDGNTEFYVRKGSTLEVGGNLFSGSNITFTDETVVGAAAFLEDATAGSITVKVIDENGDATGIEYAMDATGNILSVTVPEPSTYAAIFGALALGLAVRQRRKARM